MTEKELQKLREERWKMINRFYPYNFTADRPKAVPLIYCRGCKKFVRLFCSCLLDIKEGDEQ